MSAFVVIDLRRYRTTIEEDGREAARALRPLTDAEVAKVAALLLTVRGAR